MNEIIRVHNLRKTFQVARRRSGLLGGLRSLVAPEFTPVQAVDGVSFSLREGELVGYLGPNGAGKSTTLKVLTGLLVPSAGEVLVNGLVPWRDRTRYVAQIGAVFGQRTALWWDLPLIDSLELLRPMYRIAEMRFRNNLRDFTDLLEMGAFLNTPVRSLSLGQRMRADLAAALMHEPALLFLDEPTIGLDVVAKERIRQFIQHIHEKRRTTIILTTHDLSDVEKLCERVIILDHGRLLYDGSLATLLDRFEGSRSLVVTFSEAVSDASLPNLPHPRLEGQQATYAFDGKQLTAVMLIEQIIARFKVADIEIRQPEIEDTIRKIYEQKLLL
jgi:ABC-2 type transport system ATP-binding protein